MPTLTPTAAARLAVARQLATEASATTRAYAARLALAPAGEWEAMMYDAQALDMVADVAAGMAITSADRRAAVALVAGMVTGMAGSVDAWRLLPWVRQVAGLRRVAAILAESFEAPVSARQDRYAVEAGDMYEEVALSLLTFSLDVREDGARVYSEGRRFHPPGKDKTHDQHRHHRR